MHLSKNIITVILPEIMEILYEYEANYGHYLKSVFSAPHPLWLFAC